MRRPLTLVVTSLALGALGACGPSGSGPEDFFGKTVADVEAAETITYRAVRKYTDSTGTESASYVEEFIQGPDNRFALSLLALNGLVPSQMNAAEYGAFQQLTALASSGRGKYLAKVRDFRIRDVELFFANYEFVVFDASEVVAGRTVQVANVQPRHADRPSYVIWIDLETLVVLKYREYLPGGALTAEMEVLEIEFAPDLSNVEFASQPVQTEIDPTQAASLVSFPVFELSYLPEGFILASTRLGAAGQPVLIRSYTDGVQEIFFAQHPSLTAAVSGAEGFARMILHDVYGAATDVSVTMEGVDLHLRTKLDPNEAALVCDSLQRVDVP